MYNPIVKDARLEKAFFVFLLCFMNGSVFPFNMDYYSKGGHTSVGGTPSHYLWAILGGSYVLVALLSVYRRGQVLRAARYCPWLVLLAVLACASVLWSTAPELTLRRSVAFLGTTWVGLYLASRFSLREVLSLLIVSFCIVTVCSLYLIAFQPEYGINPAPHQGAWRGVFSQKNAFGIYCSFFFVIFLVGAATFQNRLGFSGYFLGLVCCSLFIYKSDSRTALTVQFLLLLTYMALVLLTPNKRRLWGQWVMVACFMVVALAPFALSTAGQAIQSYQETSLQETSPKDSSPKDSSPKDSSPKDSSPKESVSKTSDFNTLNGRTIIWSEVMKKAMQRPALGYGYVGSIWPEPPHAGEPYSEIKSKIKKKMNFYVAESHNGYLQIFLALGGVGILIFVIAVMLIFRDIVRTGTSLGLKIENLFSCSFLVWLLSVNTLIPNIIGQNVLYWPMLIVAAVAVRQLMPGIKARRAANTQPKDTSTHVI